MGAGIVILVWLFLAAIYGAFWLGFLALLVIGRRKQSRALVWLGGVPLALSSLGIVAAIVVAISSYIWNAQPANIYQLSFDSPPPADVSALKSKNFAFADTGTTFLKFRAAPATVRKLTGKGWKEIRGDAWQNEDFTEFLDNDAPDWWLPSKAKGTRIWVASDRFKNFAGENEILIYDSVTQQTHYAFVGID